MLTYIISHLWALGGTVAVVQSFDEHKSIPKAAFHGLFGWLYPLYKWVVK